MNNSNKTGDGPGEDALATSDRNREGEIDKGAPVVMPFYVPFGTPIKPVWEPGVIEVILERPIPNEALMATEFEPSDARGFADAEMIDLIDLIDTLKKFNIERVESSFHRLTLKEDDASPIDTQEHGRENYKTLYFPFESDVVYISRALNKLSLIAHAVPVPKSAPPDTPKNEPVSGRLIGQIAFNPTTGHYNQWYVARCHTDGAWDNLGASGTGVVVADIDFGFRVTHEDLRDRIKLRYNSFDGSTNVSQDGGTSHGTAVLGIVGAADNDLGIIGFAYGADLWAVQANFGRGPKLDGNPWANGIDWVREANSGGRRKVIILENQTAAMGNIEMVPSVNRAIRDAIAANIVVCVAAGNGPRDVGIDDLGNPIPPTGSILVGATRYDSLENHRIGFSNFGDRVIVSAPGDLEFDLTCSNATDRKYRDGFGGTSGATPKVAGAAALMLQMNSALSHREVRDILHSTGTEVITEPGRPVGTFLHVEAAVQEAIRRKGLSQARASTTREGDSATRPD